MQAIIVIKKLSEFKASCFGILGDPFTISAITQDDFDKQLLNRVASQAELTDQKVFVQIQDLDGKKIIKKFDRNNSLLINSEEKVKLPKPPINKKIVAIPCAAVLIIGLVVSGSFYISRIFQPTQDDSYLWLQDVNFSDKVSTDQTISSPTTSTENNSEPETSESSPSSVPSTEPTQTQEYNPPVYTPAPAPQPQPKPSPATSIPIEETEIFVTE
jgi:hypothetical protein